MRAALTQEVNQLRTTGCEEGSRILGRGRAAPLRHRSRRFLPSSVVAFHSWSTRTMLSAPRHFEQNNLAGTSPIPGNQFRKAIP